MLRLARGALRHRLFRLCTTRCVEPDRGPLTHRKTWREEEGAEKRKAGGVPGPGSSLTRGARSRLEGGPNSGQAAGAGAGSGSMSRSRQQGQTPRTGYVFAGCVCYTQEDCVAQIGQGGRWPRGRRTTGRSQARWRRDAADRRQPGLRPGRGASPRRAPSDVSPRISADGRPQEGAGRSSSTPTPAVLAGPRSAGAGP